MQKFINKLTGTDMWVADDRVEEYKAAGHVPAVAFMNAPEDAGKPTETKKPVVRKATKRVKK